jgi:hypothetical protein
MFYLYENRVDPAWYLGQGGTVSGGFAQWHTIGMYQFRPLNWKERQPAERILYIGNISDFPTGTGGIVFSAKNGQPEILAVSYAQ